MHIPEKPRNNPTEATEQTPQIQEGEVPSRALVLLEELQKEERTQEEQLQLMHAYLDVRDAEKKTVRLHTLHECDAVREEVAA